MGENVRLSTAHPFFTEILAMPEEGVLDPHGVVRRVTQAGADTRYRFLDTLNAAYVPVCRTAPAVFERILTNVKDPAVLARARHLCEVEHGLHPLVDGSPKTPHQELFTQMLQGLTNKPLRALSLNESDALIAKLGIPTAQMPQLVSYARTIEGDFAPPLANSWNDFMTQWIALTGMTSGDVNWRFIDEHRLTEGTGEDPDTSGMHVDVIEAMCAPYADDLTTSYEGYRAQYHRVLCEHFDRYVAALRQLLVAA